MAFNENNPAQGNQALSDIDEIRANLNALREMESSPYASPPSNPVAGMPWRASDTGAVYQRNSANSAWLYLWTESDLPAKSSDFSSHEALNITSSVTVHGIKQGNGNGLDADTVDGSHASSFAASSHVSAATGIHGVGGSTVESAVGSQAKVDAHAVLVDNPHAVTLAQVGAMASGAVITPAQLSSMVVGNYQISMNAAERTVSPGTTWGKVKQSKIGAPGAYRIKFSGKGGTGANTRFAVFRNGVMVGPEQNGSSSYIELSQDISGWSANDLLQIYARNAIGTDALYVKNLEILVDAAHVTVYDPYSY